MTQPPGGAKISLNEKDDDDKKLQIELKNCRNQINQQKEYIHQLKSTIKILKKEMKKLKNMITKGEHCSICDELIEYKSVHCYTYSKCCHVQISNQESCACILKI